jgi:hypothetical protein
MAKQLCVYMGSSLQALALFASQSLPAAMLWHGLIHKHLDHPAIAAWLGWPLGKGGAEVRHARKGGRQKENQQASST